MNLDFEKKLILKIVIYVIIIIAAYFAGKFALTKLKDILGGLGDLFNAIGESFMHRTGIKPENSCITNKTEAEKKKEKWCGDCDTFGEDIRPRSIKWSNGIYDRCATKEEIDADEGNVLYSNPEDFNFRDGQHMCDITKDLSSSESCLRCQYGWRRPQGEMRDWCCKKNEDNCNKIEVWMPDIYESGSTSILKSMDELKKIINASGEFNVDDENISGKWVMRNPDSYDSNIHTYPTENLNQQDLAKFIEYTAHVSKNQILRPGGIDDNQMCDTRKDQKQVDSCLNCAHGFKRGIRGDLLNDMCCEKDDEDCTQISELKSRISDPEYISLSTNINNINSNSAILQNHKKIYIDKAGGDGIHSICDTTLDDSDASSCMNCKWGYRRPRGNLNDWCCEKNEYDDGECNDIKRQDKKYYSDMYLSTNIHNEDGGVMNTRELPKFINGKREYKNIRAAEQFCTIDNDQNDYKDCLNCEFGFYWNGANNICVKKDDIRNGGQWGPAAVGTGIGSFTIIDNNEEEVDNEDFKNEVNLGDKDIFVLFTHDPTPQNANLAFTSQKDTYNINSKTFATLDKDLNVIIRGHNFEEGKSYKLFKVNVDADEYELPKGNPAAQSNYKLRVDTVKKYYRYAVPEKQCDTRLDSGHRESCLLCEFGSIFHGAVNVGNDWCCSAKEAEEGKCSAPKYSLLENNKIEYGKLSEKYICDIRADHKDKPDSCSLCKYGATKYWGSTNHHCCTERENEMGKCINEINNVGTLCDRRFQEMDDGDTIWDSCLNCKYGFDVKGSKDIFNDKCCTQQELLDGKCKIHINQEKGKGNYRYSIQPSTYCKDPVKEQDNLLSCNNCSTSKFETGMTGYRYCCGEGKDGCTKIACPTSDCNGTNKFGDKKEGDYCDSRKGLDNKDSCLYCLRNSYAGGRYHATSPWDTKYPPTTWRNDYCCDSRGMVRGHYCNIQNS